MTKVNFEELEQGSWYTITGAGGDLEKWKIGYETELITMDIGHLKPQSWVSFKGREMNEHYGLSGDTAYPDDLTFLAFPLDGLHVGKLAMFKLQHEDRWFDDIVANNRMRQAQSK